MLSTKKHLLTLIVAAMASASAIAQNTSSDTSFVRQNYTKLDRQIVMRDGTKLYTIIYVPKDAGATNKYPFLMERTPYSIDPYGEGNYPRTGPGPGRDLSQEKYIFVYQDVRGRYMSEGDFEEMTPGHGEPNAHLKAAKPKKGKAATPVKGPVDESTDTYDTIEWLLKNIPDNNGRVGMTGISYPGFYASAALPDAHPALKAVSPQAPVTDEFMGDDARHNGAFFLLDNFSFMNYFDAPRTGPLQNYAPLFSMQTKDAYQYFLNLGPVKNANAATLYNNKGKIWNEYLEHDTYDDYWKARNIRTHLKNIKPATLVVGGWFDAEDLFGALRTYEAIEKQSSGNQNRLVMGPWTHGAWSRDNWSDFGPLSFGQNTAKYYRDNLENQFFAFYLKDKGTFNAGEATLFNTGTNDWKSFDTWPPAAAQAQTFYFNDNGALSAAAPATTNAFDEYVSDPKKPVPYTDGIFPRRNNQYMIEDQRFAARRPDVLVFQTEPLTEDLTLSGPVMANLFASTTGTDADFIVKIIDVLPDNTPNPNPNPKGLQMAGYQRLVRAEVMRGRFRNSFEKPEAFTPGEASKVSFTLPDVLHTFQKGHRLMVQVQSSWFPLVDMNPQTFVRMKDAEAKDFQKATIRLYHDAAHPSGITVNVLK